MQNVYPKVLQCAFSSPQSIVSDAVDSCPFLHVTTMPSATVPDAPTHWHVWPFVRVALMHLPEANEVI